MAAFGAVLDTSVLVPAALRDTLLRLAERDLYRPIWSERILEELKRTLLTVRPDLGEGRVDAQIHTLNTVFEDACATGWEQLVPGLVLPDPDDRHVLAAAIRGRAEVIVTANLKDFPAEALEPLGLHAVSPDDFLLDQLDLDPDGTVELLSEQAADKKRPPLTVRDVLESLTRAGVPLFAGAVTKVIAERGD